jgi:hypothetical protein
MNADAFRDVIVAVRNGRPSTPMPRAASTLGSSWTRTANFWLP